MKNYIPLLILIILCSACTKGDKRKVVSEVENGQAENKNIKTVDIADLPIHIDSTHYLVHPIGTYILKKDRSDYSKYGSYRLDNYDISSQSGDRITGNLSNVKFQRIDANELKSLTEENLNISSMTFIRDVFKKIEKGYLIYDVIDKDTNADGTLDFNDLRSLYMSNLNGTSFRKLSPNGQDLIKWKVILAANKLYFKSLEDTNNDGEFNKKDQFHYFFIDLSDDTSKVVEYHPI